VDAGKGNISDISQLCDRTSADVRGVKKHWVKLALTYSP
jgi:hypothetical protein